MTEAREAMLRLAGLIVERLDALGSECGENCNPKDPIKAIGVLTEAAATGQQYLVWKLLPVLSAARGVQAIQ